MAQQGPFWALPAYVTTLRYGRAAPCRCERSAGGPAGDEYAQTRGGNNNWYGHDTKMTRFEWNELEAVRSGFFRFYRSVSALF